MRRGINSADGYCGRCAAESGLSGLREGVGRSWGRDGTVGGIGRRMTSGVDGKGGEASDGIRTVGRPWVEG